jgi:hypothetical protein
MELEQHLNQTTVMEHYVAPEAGLPTADTLRGTAYAAELAGIEAATLKRDLLGALALNKMYLTNQLRSVPDDDPVDDGDDWSGSQ